MHLYLAIDPPALTIGHVTALNEPAAIAIPVNTEIRIQSISDGFGQRPVEKEKDAG